jgi:hypothetical protein
LKKNLLYVILYVVFINKKSMTTNNSKNNDIFVEKFYNDFNLVFVYKTVYWNSTAWYWIYLINNSDKEYKVNYDTNWYFSDEDEVHKLIGSSKKLWLLKANSRILIEEQDLWALDYVWFVNLKLNWNDNFEINFDIWKWHPSWKKIKIDWFNEMWINMNYWIKKI